MPQNIVLFDIWLLSSLALQVASYNYCYGGAQKELCNNEHHILCDPSQVPRKETLKNMLPMTYKVREEILKQHNEFRDRVASGQMKNKAGVKFPQASRMMELDWDNELAYLAGLHASRCNTQRDKCHNTKRFPFSGQNVASTPISEDEPMMSKIQKIINQWLDEKENVQAVSDLEQYSPDKGKLIGRLTCLLGERSSLIGCAVAWCESNIYMTCNYEADNLKDTPVYASGPPTSKCSDWNAYSSKKYDNLCGKTEDLVDAAVKIIASAMAHQSKATKAADVDASNTTTCVSNSTDVTSITTELTGNTAATKPTHPTATTLECNDTVATSTEHDFPTAHSTQCDIELKPITSLDKDIFD